MSALDYSFKEMNLKKRCELLAKNFDQFTSKRQDLLLEKLSTEVLATDSTFALSMEPIYNLMNLSPQQSFGKTTNQF